MKCFHLHFEFISNACSNILMANYRHIVVCEKIRKNTRLLGAMSTMFFLKESADFRSIFTLPRGLGVINLIPGDLRHGGRFELVLHSHTPP